METVGGVVLWVVQKTGTQESRIERLPTHLLTKRTHRRSFAPGRGDDNGVFPIVQSEAVMVIRPNRS